MSLRLLAFIPLALSCCVRAQDFGVPSGWWNTDDTTLSHDQRVAKAQAAVTQILPQLDTSLGEFNGIGYWQSGNVWSAMANLDHITGQTTYKSQVTSGLTTSFNLNANFDKFGYNDDAMWWATAAMYAHRAYGDDTFLNYAEATWNHVSQFVITSSVASSGSLSGKNFHIAGTCKGVTMVGGVFWRPTSGDSSVNAVTTGLYIALSGYLAEATGNSMYTNAAIQSAQWIVNQDFDPNQNLVLDTVDGSSCSTSPASWLFTYNTGKFLEGLSILATLTGDSTYTTMIGNIVAASTKTSVWEGSNGIITEGASPSSNNDGVGFKAVFIRGLYEVLTRSSNNDMNILIHSYVDVQYNALLDLAATGDTYSSSWTGPPQSFTTWGQLAALDVLNTAIVANSP